MRHFLILTALLASPAMAQYIGPESVEYDPVGDRYFISNTGSGFIKQRTQAGVVTDFVTVSPSPYGLEIMGDVLYACSAGSVKGYSLASAAQVFNLNLGATFLNGITTDGTHLYVTDFSNAEILKVDPVNNTYTTLVPNTGGTPNGIVYVPNTNLLLVAGWGANALVRSFDRVSGATLSSVATSLSNIDGITLDCLGRVLLASWSPDRITAFEWGVVPAVFTDLMVPGLNNPADIDFDSVNNRICIPNSGNNTVVLHDFNCSSGIATPSDASLLRAIPNPTPGLVRLDPPLTRDEAYILLDARGLLIGGGTLRQGALLDLTRLSNGAYVIELTRTAQRVRVVKE